MGTYYFEQLQRNLEPENTSTHSKTKKITSDIQQNSSARGPATGLKNKQELLRKQRTIDSFGSFDYRALE